MDNLITYSTDYAKFLLRSFIFRPKNYERLSANNFNLIATKIVNKPLVKEIERACLKKGGILTYAEFLTIDQFGLNGYHSTHAEHGMTHVHEDWGEAISKLCLKKKISQIIEFGPGAGDLAVEILKANKNKKMIHWSGVEVNSDLIKEIKVRFQKNGFKSNFNQLVKTIKDLKYQKNALIIFSYSLDSLPPQIFINTQNKKTYPDNMIGITVKNGILKEVLLNKKDLKERDISLKDGIYTDRDSMLDLSSWTLHPGQRAYINTNFLSVLHSFTKLFPDATFIILDEFRYSPRIWERGNLLVPKGLNKDKAKRDLNDPEAGYRESGSNLLYFPIYFFTFYKFLNSLGFRSIKYDIDQKMGTEMAGQQWRNILNVVFYTYAFIASDKKQEKNPLSVDFPKEKLI